MPPANDHSEAVEIALLRADVESLKATIDTQSKQIAELVKAWQAAETLVSFVKLAGSLAIAVGAIIAFIKTYGAK